MVAELSSAPLTAPPVGLFSNEKIGAIAELSAIVGEALDQSCEILHLQNKDTKHGDQITGRSLVIIDCASYAPNRIQEWLNQYQEKTVPPVVLFNTEPGSLHESLLEWPCVRGLFFRDTDAQQLVDGLKVILEGELWVPRRLMQAYLERYRRAPTHGIKAPELLTKREREILILLEKGATNAAMAKAVEVSEHTIKTHLYNIYKKIDVANRIEAINWSRQNLTALQAND